jgi:hypothetical protein
MFHTDVLIYVEEAGAANYVAELPAALAQHGWQTRLLAGGTAMDCLLQRGIHAERVSRPGAAREVLAAGRPRLLIVGTAEDPDALGLALVAEARRQCVPSVTVVDARMNAAYRF